MDDYREDLAYQHTEALSKWHRFIGTEGESKARQYIYDQFTGLGIECRLEPFTCSNFLVKYMLRLALIFASIILITAAYLYMQGTISLLQNFFIYSLLFALVLIACLPIMNRFMSSSEFGSNWGTTYESENLIGYMKARNPNPKNTVVLMSHYDTKSQTYPILLRVILFTIGLFGGVVIVLLTLISTIYYLISSSILIPGGVIFYGAVTFCVCLVIILFNRTGNNSVGATDNAAAVGIQIAIIRDLLDFPPENTDVYFLSTSAEEIGLFGAIAYIKKHETEFNKDKTYFINYEMIGGKGKILLHSKYGLPPKSTSKEINNILLGIAKEKNLDVGTEYLPTGAMADHFAILRRSFKTTMIESGDRKVTFNVHSPKDNMNLITKETLRTAIILGFEFIQKIDKNS